MPIIEKFARSFFGFIISNPRIVLSGFLIAAGALGYQARHFEINASADTLLMKGDRHYIQTRVVNRRFSPQEEFLLIGYKPKNHPLFSEKTFKDLKELSEKLRKLDRVESVRSILNVPILSNLEKRPTSSRFDGPASSESDLAEMTIEKQNYSIDEIKEVLGGHPLYEDLLINKDQTATAIQVLFKRSKKLDLIQNRILDLQKKILKEGLSKKDLEKIARLKKKSAPIEKRYDRIRSSEFKEIRRIAAEYEKDAKIYLGGLHVLAYQLVRIIKHDLIVFGGAIAVMICLVLYWLFRKVRWVIIPVVCCICSALSTLGLFGMLDLKATVISSSFISLQLILTLGITIHLIVQYREYCADHPEWGQEELVTKTVLRKAGPCFYAGLTNIVGFASLLFCNIKPVVDFGWMMSIAMFFSIGVSLILFPSMMAMFKREEVAKPRKFSLPIMNFFMWLTSKHASLIVMITTGILIASLMSITRLNVENSFINYFRSSTQINKELSFVDQEFGGSTPLDIVYTIPKDERKKDLVMTANSIYTLQRIQHALKKHKAMGKMLSIVNFTEVAKKLNDNKPLTEYELTAVYWLMQDEGSDLAGSFFSSKDSQVRFNVRIKDSTEGLSRNQLLLAIQNDMEKIGIPKDRYLLTNLFILYHDMLQQLFQSQILTLGITFIVLALTMLVIFRSVKIALIGVLPNILSTLMVLGIMGLAGIPLDLMTIMIASVAMGISVDDTIHYIHRYLEELQHSSAQEAIKRTQDSVGYAMLCTTLIVVLGFSLLIFSDFIPSVLFGLLTGFAMGMAVVFDFSILPVLLKKFVKGKTQHDGVRREVRQEARDLAGFPIRRGKPFMS